MQKTGSHPRQNSDGTMLRMVTKAPKLLALDSKTQTFQFPCVYYHLLRLALVVLCSSLACFATRHWAIYNRLSLFQSCSEACRQRVDSRHFKKLAKAKIIPYSNYPIIVFCYNLPRPTHNSPTNRPERQLWCSITGSSNHL